MVEPGVILPENVYKKETKPKFTRSEIEKLQTLGTQYKDILLSKKNDVTSSKQRDNVWNFILIQFNVIGETQRTLKELKSIFEKRIKKGMKKTNKTRHEESNIRRPMNKKKSMMLDELHQLDLRKLYDSIIHQKEKHKLEIKKLELEIELLKCTKNKILEKLQLIECN